MAIENLIEKQEELMEKVPHELKPKSFALMLQSKGIIEALLMYLNSTGHKPWRPVPLSKEEQDDRRHRFVSLASLMNDNGDKTIDTLVNMGMKVPAKYSRQLVSGFGVIEETIEYLNSLQSNHTDSERLEELVDQLFFWLEQVILSGFSWKQIEAEYYRKHAVNLKRYEDAKSGDYSWDHKDKPEL